MYSSWLRVVQSTKAWRFVRNPRIGMFGVGALLLVISTALTYHHTAYTSDDVMFQNALLHWRPFSGDIFFDNSDGTFILQAPLYWLVSVFIPAGRSAMFADGILLTLITFGCLYYPLLYFLRVLRVRISWLSLAPVVLLGVFGYGINRLFLGTNYHTVAAGLILVVLMLVSKLCRGELGGGRWQYRVLTSAAVAILVGLAAVNDRYFLYYGVSSAVALVAFYLYKNALSFKRAAAIVMVLALGCGLAAAIRYVLPSVGIVLAFGVDPPSFAAFNAVGPYVMNTIHSLCYIMGINFFGQPAASVETAVSLINLTALVATIIASVRLLRGPKVAPELMTLIGLFWFVIATYALSSFSLGTLQTYRYLTVVPLLAVVILAVYLGTVRFPQARHVKRVMAIMAVVAVAIGVWANSVSSIAVSAATEVGWNTSNAANLQLIQQLERTGVSKGYAEYWSSHINTYLSGGRVSIQPVSCDGGTTIPYAPFVDQSQYLRPTSSSFYIFVSNAPLCSAAQVRQQFGDPVRTVEIGVNTIWIYNYDLGSRMDLSAIRRN